MIIQKPIITERSMEEAKKGIYTFRVTPTASKYQIKLGIERLYNVHVEKVSTNNMPGKIRRAGKKRSPVARPDWKKARVQLKEGETIRVFEVSAT